jgi:hypothetical protein
MLKELFSKKFLEQGLWGLAPIKMLYTGGEAPE